MSDASVALVRLGALCAVAALADLFAQGGKLKSGVRLIAALLLVLAMADLGRNLAASIGWLA